VDSKSRQQLLEKAQSLLGDPKGFFSWLSELSEADRQVVLRAAGSSLALSKGREQLAGLVKFSKNSNDKWHLVNAYCSTIAGTDADASHLFRTDPALLSLVDQRQKNALVGAFASSLAIKGSAMEAVLLIKEFGSYNDPSAARMVASRWAITDPEACMKWVAGIPEGDFKDLSFRGAISSWVQSKPDDAAHYVEQLPQGYARDLALKEMAVTCRVESVEKASRWAESIQDEALRKEALQSVSLLKSK
jgi:hypothetical protein